MLLAKTRSKKFRAQHLTLTTAAGRGLATDEELDVGDNDNAGND